MKNSIQISFTIRNLPGLKIKWEQLFKKILFILAAKFETLLNLIYETLKCKEKKIVLKPHLWNIIARYWKKKSLQFLLLMTINLLKISFANLFHSFFAKQFSIIENNSHCTKMKKSVIIFCPWQLIPLPISTCKILN